MILYVTGTDTGVGKTIATAALAVALGGTVAVYKPVQAGLEAGRGDIDVVARLAGAKVTVSEGIRLPLPMAPLAAAQRSGMVLPDASTHREAILALAHDHDHVLVEGAGGLLVELAPNDTSAGKRVSSRAGATLLDLVVTGGRFIVVARAGLGTLNHTTLTLEALAHRRRPVLGILTGSFPARPSAIETDNRIALARLAQLARAAQLGEIPQDAAMLAPEEFQRQAPIWLTMAPASECADAHRPKS